MIPYPHITGRTSEEKLESIRRELFKLVEQLNAELAEIRRKENDNGNS